MPTEMSSDLRAVYAFWNTEPIGARFLAKRGSVREAFATYRELRYRMEWYIPAFGRLVPRAIERGLGALLGWHLQIRAVK